MRCEFCGEDIEGHPFYKDGMCFCSLECADAMEGGETIPLGEDILNDPDDAEEVDEDAVGKEEDDDDDAYEEEVFGEDIYDEERGY